jgi:hypothetical protein
MHKCIANGTHVGFNTRNSLASLTRNSLASLTRNGSQVPRTFSCARLFDLRLLIQKKKKLIPSLRNDLLN